MNIRDLWDACRDDNANKVVKILQEHPQEFDLIDNAGSAHEGIYFIFALKFQNVKMLTSLLDYYDQRELKGDYFSDRSARIKMMKILDEVSERGDVTLTPEIKEIIKSYESKAMAVEGEDGAIIPDYYDKDDTDEGRDSKDSADHSDDILPFIEGNTALLGNCSARDSDSSEEGV